MSDKLTEEKIEEMIEELLQEEQERLDEKKWPYDIKGLDFEKHGTGNPVFSTSKQVDNVWKDSGYSKRSSVDTQLKNIAKSDGTADDLSKKDFKQSYKGKDSKKDKLIVSVAANARNATVRNAVADVVNALGGGGGDSFKDASDDLNTTTYATKAEPQATGGGLDLDYHAATDAASWTPGSAIKSAGSIDPGTVAIIKAEITKHKSLDGMFAHYATLADNIKDAAGGNTSAIAAMKTEDLFTSLEVITTLSYAANMFQGASAGTVFETVLALISGGVVVGGGGGAADVLAGKKGKFMLSAKNYALSNVKTAVGGEQSKTNIGALKMGETYWYIGFGKIGAKGKVHTLKIQICGIRRETSGSSGSAFKAYAADGTRVIAKKLENASGAKGSTHFKIPFEAKTKGDYLIPFGKLARGNYINLEALASAAIKKANDTTQMHIRDVYDKLKKLRSNTQMFLAQVKEGDSGGATDTASATGKMYGDLKTNFKTGFEDVQAGAGAKFQESKLESLDDLIAETMRDIKRKRKK
jgi:hypothetical protein